jgi:transposase
VAAPQLCCGPGPMISPVMMMDRDCALMNGMETESDTSTQTTARMSAPSRRIEVITGAERRRRWSWEEKRAIVEESLLPRISVAAVARRHGIGTGQLYTWRHQLSKLVGRPCFARVEVAEEPAAPTCLTATAPIVIEIALTDGTLVRVKADVDATALRCVLGVLRG